MTLDELRSFGAKVDEGLERCMNNEEFYMKMVGKCLDDPKFADLGSALKAGDLDDAFEQAHAIKGVVSNLSLTPLQEKVEEITELLRARTQMDYTEIYDSIMHIRDDIAALR